jgi:tRNA G46 methylase TrmB
LRDLLANYPGKFAVASAFFPDPYSKKKRLAKRRMLNDEFLKELADLLAPGALAFKTDVRLVDDYVRESMARLTDRYTSSSVAEIGATAPLLQTVDGAPPSPLAVAQLAIHTDTEWHLLKNSNAVYSASFTVQ